MITAGWAAIMMDCKCYFWQVIGDPGKKEISEEWGRLQKSLGEARIVTTTQHLALFRGLEGVGDLPICLDRLPIPKQPVVSHRDRAGSDGAFYFKTSGTTGDPKLAVLPYSVQLARIYSSRELSNSRRLLSWLPIDNITGSSSALFPNGDVTVLLSPACFATTPFKFFEAIEKYNIEAFSLSSSVAAKLNRILMSQSHSFDLSSLKGIGVGLEPISLSVIRKFVELVKDYGVKELKIIFGYGLTEVGRVACSTVYTCQNLDTLEQNGQHIPMVNCAAGRKIQVVNSEGNQLPIGEVGHIQVYAPGRTIKGYLLANGDFIKTKLENSWLDTGDLGKIEEHGLQVTGREKSIVFVDGKNISLQGIEELVSQTGLVKQGLVGVTPIETVDNASAYIVFFSLVEESSETQLPYGTAKTDVIIAREQVAIKQIGSIATRQVGLAPKYVVSLAKEDFSYTRTGKLDRRQTALAALKKAEEAASVKIEKHKDQSTGWDLPRQRQLKNAWMRILNTDREPSPKDNFFECGGTSFLAMNFLHCVENILNLRLPIAKFYENPSLVNIWQIFKKRGHKGYIKVDTSGSYLELMFNMVRGWAGTGKESKSFIRGHNTNGSKPPLFWVFQEEFELLHLAKALGRDQPLYGMRSLVGITRVADLEERILTEIGNQYIIELLTVVGEKPFFLGGNCQAAILALSMAKELDRLNKKPTLLFLMEWTFSWGPYPNPTVFLYGEESHTAKIYGADHSIGHAWREDFKNSVERSIKGQHGQFFSTVEVEFLAEAIASEIGKTQDIDIKYHD